MKKMIITLLMACFASGSNAEPIEAPSFTLADTSGHQITLPSKQAGADIYFFWASWCPYCKALMPPLEKIQADYGDDVRIYALNIRDDEDPVEFMQEFGYEFILLPEADPVMALYGVRATPAVFVVDQDGLIRFNLYEMVHNDSPKYETLSHRKKASRRAPRWTKEIRKAIDGILEP